MTVVFVAALVLLAVGVVLGIYAGALWLEVKLEELGWLHDEVLKSAEPPSIEDAQRGPRHPASRSLVR